MEAISSGTRRHDSARGPVDERDRGASPAGGDDADQRPGAGLLAENAHRTDGDVPRAGEYQATVQEPFGRRRAKRLSLSEEIGRPTDETDRRHAEEAVGASRGDDHRHRGGNESLHGDLRGNGAEVQRRGRAYAGVHLREALFHHLPGGERRRRVLPDVGEGLAARGLPPRSNAGESLQQFGAWLGAAHERREEQNLPGLRVDRTFGGRQRDGAFGQQQDHQPGFACEGGVQENLGTGRWRVRRHACGVPNAGVARRRDRGVCRKFKREQRARDQQRRGVQNGERFGGLRWPSSNGESFGGDTEREPSSTAAPSPSEAVSTVGEGEKESGSFEQVGSGDGVPGRSAALPGDRKFGELAGENYRATVGDHGNDPDQRLVVHPRGFLADVQRSRAHKSASLLLAIDRGQTKQRVAAACARAGRSHLWQSRENGPPLRLLQAGVGLLRVRSRAHAGGRAKARAVLHPDPGDRAKCDWQHSERLHHKHGYREGCLRVYNRARSLRETDALANRQRRTEGLHIETGAEIHPAIPDRPGDRSRANAAGCDPIYHQHHSQIGTSIFGRACRLFGGESAGGIVHEQTRRRIDREGPTAHA